MKLSKLQANIAISRVGKEKYHAHLLKARKNGLYGSYDGAKDEIAIVDDCFYNFRAWAIKKRDNLNIRIKNEKDSKKREGLIGARDWINKNILEGVL